jgi:hypothetical protein
MKILKILLIIHSSLRFAGTNLLDLNYIFFAAVDVDKRFDEQKIWKLSFNPSFF